MILQIRRSIMLTHLGLGGKLVPKKVPKNDAK
jgi:hypothetical protein